MENNETKTKIKQAVIDILKYDSDKKLNMRNISQETGLSPGTIYYHFPNKAEIVIEVVDELWSECFENIPLKSFDVKITSALGQLYEHILKYFLSFRDNWIKELSKLGRDEAADGRRFEAGYMVRLKEIITEILKERESQISKECLSVLTMPQIVDFVYINFMANIKSGEQDSKNLMYVIEKVICR